jgi:hypothetical protein
LNLRIYRKSTAHADRAVRYGGIGTGICRFARIIWSLTLDRKRNAENRVPSFGKDVLVE